MPFTPRAKMRATGRFGMRLSVEEHVRLREDADLAGLTISELVRRRVFQRPVHAVTDLTMVRELRRLGGLQKYSISKAIQHREVVAECIATIKALRSAIERVGKP